MMQTDARWPVGDGEMAGRIRAHDWAATQLGHVAGWSERLKLTVEQVLGNPLVSTLTCGPQRLLVYNDAAAQLFGNHHPAALGQPLLDAFPEDWAAVAPCYARAFSGETVQVRDHPFGTCRQGTTTDVVDARLAPVRESDGTIAYVHMTGAEAGTRGQTEAALRESETRLRLLIESWAQAMWETDARGVVVADSPSWRAYTGQTREEWLGYGWLDAIHPDDRAYAERQWRDAIADLRLLNAEFRLRAPDGGWRWTNVRASPVLDGGGRVEKWTGLNIDIDARKRAEAALRQSEERYRALFGSMDEAYAVVEVLKGGAGQWVDFRFLDANRAFVEHTSMPHPVGKTAAELLGSPNPRWTELYGQALDTGAPIRVEETEHTLGRTFDLNIFALDRAQDQVAVLFTDITARKRAEAALRESEERQAFLLKLMDRLRPIANPAEVQRIATRMLGEHIKASRVFYVAVDQDGDTAAILGDYTDGVPSRVGRYSLGAFSAHALAEWRAGRTASTSDVNVDPRYGDAERDAYASVSTRAGFGVPLIKDGRLVAILGVNQAEPRPWSDDDIALASETAERTWAAVERAHVETALRESEERFQQFARASAAGLWIRNADTLAMEFVSPAVETIYGAEPDSLLGDVTRWAAMIVPEDRDAAIEHLGTARAGDTAVHEFRIQRFTDGEERWIRNTSFPLLDARGRVQRIGGIAEDVTELKQTEAALVAAEARQRALIEGVPQLVWRAVDGGRWTWASPQWTAYTGQSDADSRGHGWLEAYHPDDRAAAMNVWREAESAGRLEIEARIYHAPDGRYRWFQTRASAERDEAGRIVGWLGTSTDIDDIRAYHERQEVMVAELQHRTRNLLGVVRSISRQTIRNSETLKEFEAAFNHRLGALSRVQGLLSRAEDAPITIGALLRSELDALGANEVSGCITTRGPEVRLRKGTVQTFALALHELATNARKYGALANGTGRLQVTWRAYTDETGRRLALEWRETGLDRSRESQSPVSQPGGYGRELIERALPYVLQARTSYDLGDTELVCTIDLPLAERAGAERVEDGERTSRAQRAAR